MSHTAHSGGAAGCACKVRSRRKTRRRPQSAATRSTHPFERRLAALHREADTLFLNAVPVVLVALVVRGVILRGGQACGKRTRIRPERRLAHRTARSRHGPPGTHRGFRHRAAVAWPQARTFAAKSDLSLFFPQTAAGLPPAACMKGGACTGPRLDKQSERKRARNIGPKSGRRPCARRQRGRPGRQGRGWTRHGRTRTHA